jgi:hypothetical protein
MLVFFICTATSGFGGYFGGVLLTVLGIECTNPAATHDSSCAFHGAIYFLIFIAYLFAWTVYLIMAASWIGKANIPRWLPVTGTLAALSFFVPEIMVGSPEHSIRSDFLVIAMQLIWVSPAVLLAIFLVVYHLSRNKTLGNESLSPK